MRRCGVAIATGLLATVGALGLAGCGAATGVAGGAERQAAVDVAAAMGVDGQALAALGFDPLEIAAADPAASPSADPSARPQRGQKGAPGDAGRKPHRARVLLRKNTLHGEVVVQTKDGVKTVAVQRGTVTAIDDASMTVKSTDGFSMTWTFGDDVRVVEHRAAIQPGDVKVGTVLGVAGTKDGDRGVARLVVIPKAR